jgi:SAM-dependent methyltransferase
MGDRLSEPSTFLLGPLRRLGGQLLPETLRAELELRRERAGFEAHLRETWGLPVRAVELGPAPDGRVASVTWGDFAHGAARRDRLRFFWLGYRLMRQFFEALHDAGFDLPAAHSILELGCGTARLLRLFRYLEGARLVGTDLDAESIAWCLERVPVAEYHVNSPHPPLAFAADKEFDLVLAAAVFVQMRSPDQREWLAEVHRILRPGGVFLCTELNETAQALYLSDAERERLRRDGELVYEASDPKASATAKLTGAVDCYLMPERARHLFAERFEIADRRDLGGGQDLYVLRKSGG